MFTLGEITLSNKKILGMSKNGLCIYENILHSSNIDAILCIKGYCVDGTTNKCTEIIESKDIN